jgi:hypothetical protein
VHPNRRPVDYVDPGATDTRSRPTLAEPKASTSKEGLSLQTLVVAAVASGVAAVLVSHVWKDGTVLAAAMTPVLVSVLKEILQRPIESDVVRRSASRVGSVAVAPAKRVASTAGATRTRSGPRPVEPAPGNGNVVHAGPRRTYGSSGREQRRRRLTPTQLRLAIVTGVLAFVVAVAALTLPELLFGGAVSSGHRTTIFGGGSSGSSSDKKDKQKDEQSNPSDNGGDQQQTQPPKSDGSTQPQTTQPQQPQQTQPPDSQTQTQPNTQTQPQQQPPSSGGGGGTTQPAPQSPVPTPPVP